MHVPQACVLKNQINLQCKGAHNVIQDLHFLSEICVVQQIPLDHFVSPSFLMRQIYKISNTDFLFFHYISQIQTKTFITLNLRIFLQKSILYHISTWGLIPPCASLTISVSHLPSPNVIVLLSHASSQHHILNTKMMV